MHAISAVKTDDLKIWLEQNYNDNVTKSLLHESISFSQHNSLLSAGSAIIAFIIQMQNYQLKLKRVQLRNMLLNEITVFEQNLVTRHFPQATIVKAKYILCAMLDEVILTQIMSEDTGGIWSQQGLVSTFFQDAWGGEKFFFILQEALAKPKVHHMLLELILMCLYLGFVGKYRNANNSKDELNTWREKIIHYLQQQTSKADFNPIGIVKSANFNIQLKNNLLTTGFIAGVTAITLTTIFICFNLQLNNFIRPVLQALQIGG